MPVFAPAAAEPDQVGAVSKVENEAQIVSASGPTGAVVGAKVRMLDELRTGEGGRLKVTFRDGTVLILGENASVTVDAYVFDPEKGVGEAALRATNGAFRFLTGKISRLRDKKIEVVTPVAQIGVRGTEFWGGPIDAKYGVLLLEGEITVTTEAGSVPLIAGQGTNIASRQEAPEAPAPWAAEKIARAVATVALH